MKKFKLLNIMVLCMVSISFFFGCSNNSKSYIYKDDKKIVSEVDSFNIRNAKHVNDKEGYDGELYFEGMDTIWAIDSNEDSDIEISYLLSVSKGKAKLVLIKPNGELETIVESDKEMKEDSNIETTISVKKGKNRIKLVGKDDARIHLKCKAEDGEFFEVGF